MALTQEQLILLASDINGNTDVSGFIVNKDATLIKNYYNTTANPEWIVWKTQVSVDEIMRNGMDWTRVDNLSVGKSRIWEWLGKLGYFNASKANIRAGIDSAWTGTAADLAVRANIYTHCKRQATRGEKLFSAGSGTTASPATMTHEGSVYDVDVQRAMGW